MNIETRCPITLDEIPEGHAFTHEGRTFDATALYVYLLQAPHLVNPVNRLIFTTPQLEALEAQMERIYGRDCIIHDFDDCASDTDSDVVVLDMQEDPDWFDEVALMNMFSTVIEEHEEDTIRLRVNLNINDIPDHDSTSSSSSLGSSTSSLRSIQDLDLPPSRVFRSLVDMANDQARSRRMTDNLQLLQFLDFEASDLVRRMLQLLDPNMFHNLVWSNTHFGIMQAVVEYLRAEDEAIEHEEDDVDSLVVLERQVGEPPPSPPPSPTYNLHVHYSDEWAMYRNRLQEQLRERYRDVMRDISRIGESHAEVSRRVHISIAEDYGRAFEDRRAGVGEILEFLHR